MMSGDVRRTSSQMMAGAGDDSAPRSLHNGRYSPTSPLKIFAQAKKQINGIFNEIEKYIVDCNKFLQGIEGDVLVTEKQVEDVGKFVAKVTGIKEILQRDRMKVAFFGRTSNGKSSVINAMLKTKVLPSGIGHTTNCFVQVEASDTSEAYILTEDSDVRKSINSVRDLAHALSTVRLDSESLLRICWPKDKCSFLKDDIVFIDSPGVDVSPDLDSWIDRHCLDADVFVLVANAESTLMQTEKNFFHKVSTKLSKPNIFILNNRWDASASEPETQEEVRRQHMERNLAFLVDELKVADRHQAENRVFFVSAREALIARTHAANTPTPTNVLLEGYQGRLFEFADFERKFEECISKSAVQTKFASHAGNGKDITSELRTNMDGVYERAMLQRANCEESHRIAKERLEFTNQQLTNVTEQAKKKIKELANEVDHKVNTSLMEELRRLSVVVDEFPRKFDPDPVEIHGYKKELHFHVDETLSRNLHMRCGSFIHQIVEVSSYEIQEQLSALLPEDAKQQVESLMPTKDFQITYNLDCRSLCADFQEDTEFRFSLGLTSLMHRFLGTKAYQTGSVSYFTQRPLVTPQPSNDRQIQTTGENEAMMQLVATFSSLYSRSTIGALAVVGLVTKAAGWRVIAVCGAVYGLLYVYERLSWTTKAKERSFKRQYVEHATNKLQMVVNLTGTNCAYQVQQELSSMLARLSRHVDSARDDLQKELQEHVKEAEKLRKVSEESKLYRNQASFLDNELNTFVHEYLKPESQL